MNQALITCSHSKETKITNSLLLPSDSYGSAPSLELVVSVCVHSVCSCGKQRSSEELRDKLVNILEERMLENGDEMLHVENKKQKYYLNLNSVDVI